MVFVAISIIVAYLTHISLLSSSGTFFGKALFSQCEYASILNSLDLFSLLMAEYWFLDPRSIAILKEYKKCC